MRHKTLFASLSVCLIVAIGFAVGVEKLTEPEVIGAPTTTETYYSPTDPGFTSNGDPLDPMSFAASAGLLTGIDQQVPLLDSMPRIATIPWSRNDVSRSFAKAGSTRSCELFSPGMQTFQKLLPVRPGVASAIGRLPVFSVGLTMDIAVREGLPQLSKNRIVSYLEDHVLVVQSKLYHDDERGVFYGDRLGAAFCATKQPDLIIKPEPMIGQSVSEFRTLGLYMPETPEGEEPDHRTLVLAFRYTASDNVLATSAAASVNEFELIFIHMLKSESASPSDIIVFATSHGLTQFHELETGSADSLIRGPSILATVRFDDFKYMGLYPSRPVVTGIRLRARLTLPTESVRAGMLGISTGQPLSLCQLLDELHIEANEQAERAKLELQSPSPE